MTVSVYDVNEFLKNDATLTSIAGKEMNFFPVIGYGDENPPFVVYYFSPSIASVDAYWMRTDTVRYSVYDSDVDRLLKISDRMILLLGRGHTVGDSGGITSSYHRFKSAIFLGSNLLEPMEKEGWYQMDLDFRIMSTSV